MVVERTISLVRSNVDQVEIQVTLESQEGDQTLGYLLIPFDSIPANAEALVIQPAKQSAPGQLTSAVVDISLVQASVSGGVTQLQPIGPLTICLLSDKSSEFDQTCLSYLDTLVDPPVWKCQDECLERVSPSMVCGLTDHLTNFAVLLTGKSNEWQNKCDKSEYYFSGSALSDGLISLGIAFVVLLIAFILVAVYHYAWKLNKRRETINRLKKNNQINESKL